MPVPHHKCRGRYGITNPAIVYQFAASLNTAAQKRIGRTPHPRAFLTRQLKRLLPICAIHGQRLFAVYILPRLNRHQIHFGMRLGNRQIHHDLNLGII